jgi:hypothetical protein
MLANSVSLLAHDNSVGNGKAVERGQPHDPAAH